MTDEELKELIEATLDIPVYDDGMSITYPAATLDIYQDSSALAGDGATKARVKNVKIDLWYQNKEERDTAQALLLGMLDGIRTASCVEILPCFDTNARKYRSTFNFEIL